MMGCHYVRGDTENIAGLENAAKELNRTSTNRRYSIDREVESDVRDQKNAMVVGGLFHQCSYTQKEKGAGRRVRERADTVDAMVSLRVGAQRVAFGEVGKKISKFEYAATDGSTDTTGAEEVGSEGGSIRETAQKTSTQAALKGDAKEKFQELESGT
ncbi:hypothetical protein B0H19DRAFT_1080259 [Mycena capillaripes]|nr:hypothetical protein B0H19DRAFT_1080259 [Mycena capillaripes]